MEKKRSCLVRAEEVVVQYNKFEVRRWDGKIALIFCHFAFAFEVCRVDSTLLPADMLLPVVPHKAVAEVSKIGNL